jgi:hypothetical protein
VSASEDFWDDILGHLKERVLLPVIGPELVTVQDGDRRVTLSRLLGERIAARYQLKVDWGPESGLDEAVGAYLAGRGEAQRLYRVVNDLLSDLNPEPAEALRQLAGIGDFRVFISTTFDSLLARALNGVRFGAEARTRELWFSPNQSTGEQQENARAPREDDTVVFKVFGKASSTPQYALHDEDILEWLHTLLTETARPLPLQEIGTAETPSAHAALPTPAEHRGSGGRTRGERERGEGWRQARARAP